MFHSFLTNESLSLEMCLPQHALGLDKPCGWSVVATVRFVGQKVERKDVLLD